MPRSLRGASRLALGSVGGVRVSLHVSWIPMAALLALAASAAFATLHPEDGPLLLAPMAAATALALFAGLLAHELAHALVANALGFPVRSIVLFAFGGAAEIEREADTPAAEAAIAIAGPACSILIGNLIAIAALLVERTGAERVASVLGALALVNIGIALFNLIPGLPLDGGRLLRATLWRAAGDHRRATHLASVVGMGVGVAVALAGMVVAALGERIGLWYVPMGGFLAVLARRASASGADTRVR